VIRGSRRRGQGDRTVLEHRTTTNSSGLEVNANINVGTNDYLGLEDVEVTPRSKKKRRHATDPAIITSDAGSESSSRSFLSLEPSLSVAKGLTASSRSSSPTKHLLRVAMRKDEPIHTRKYNAGQNVSDEFPRALVDMWTTVRKCSRRAVIPSALERDIRQRYSSDAELLDGRDFFDDPSALTMEHLNDLLRGARKSFMKTEPHWNCALHFPALDRAVQTANICSHDDVNIENM
jgi:hypothetical protein